MSGWGEWGTIVLAVVAVAGYVAIVTAIVRAVRRRVDTTPLEQTVWTIAVVLFPIGAGAVWLLLGPHPLGLRIDHEPD
jgi:branched-subunit amino acid ABC-type transport system permease component